MALDIRLELPKSAERRLLSFLDPRRMAWVEKEAVNRTAGNVQSHAIELVSEEMGIPRTKLAKRGRRVFSGGDAKYGTVSKGRRATTRRLFTTVHGVGRPFNVVRFGGTPIRGENGRTIGVSHKAWGREQVAQGPWQLRNKPGRPFVIRQGNSFRGVFGPGVRHVLEYPRVRRAIEEEAQRRFRVHFASRLRYAFGAQSHLR